MTNLCVCLNRNDESKFVVHVAWVSVGVAGIVSIPLAVVWALLTPPSPSAPDGYVTAVIVFALDALFEILSEPFAAMAQYNQQYNVRLHVESAAGVARCFLSYVFVAFIPAEIITPLVCLALGQVSYGIVLLGGYIIRALVGKKTEEKKAGDADKEKGPFLSTDVWRLFAVYEWQAAQKVVLQEGEKFVLVVTGAKAAVSADVSAVYSVVNNLGSLVVRFVFAPVEEVCFTAFGKLVSAGDAKSARSVLRTVLRFVSLIGLCFVAFGPGYSRAVIQIIYGAKYSETDAPLVLAFYCQYILLMALNGTSEAFVHSVASEKQLKFANVLFVGFSAFFVAAAAILLHIPGMAAVGLVVANGLNMMVRITYSFIFISNWQKEKNLDKEGKPADRVSLLNILPDRMVLATLVAALSCGLASAKYSPNIFVHIAIGCVLFGCFIIAV